MLMDLHQVEVEYMVRLEIKVVLEGLVDGGGNVAWNPIVVDHFDSQGRVVIVRRPSRQSV